MARRWGKVDYKELEKLRDNLQKMQTVDMNSFCNQMSKELAARLLRRVRQKTPVGQAPAWVDDEILQKYWEGYQGGELRRNWKTSEITHSGGEYRITVYNPLEYASYVEYGHRQKVGRYVPQIGRRLKNGWVEGQFMLKISEEEIQRIAPALLEKKLNQKLREVFDVD